MVDILLATYNGELYVRQQIESILQQTFSDFRLYIRDDGSTDLTVDIINQINDDRIIFIKDDKICKSSGLNFKELLQHSTSEYVFFADQDDYWCKDKISRTLSYIDKSDRPKLVYCNGYVTDEKLEGNNVLVYDNKKNLVKIKDFLFFNGGIQGCALCVNRNLIDLIDFNNTHWYMHDQVLSFYAAAYGEIEFIDIPLFYYRQHE
ncbi:glycosyltransferase family 2 protein, partial [Photobacterium phosphoreum]|uniref:glycosyltransferase n=1 Tax=Photobacterium phosphoreum TaxID=659 RepID=UPI000D4E4915